MGRFSFASCHNENSSKDHCVNPFGRGFDTPSRDSIANEGAMWMRDIGPFTCFFMVRSLLRAVKLGHKFSLGWICLFLRRRL
mgnify:FL=1